MTVGGTPATGLVALPDRVGFQVPNSVTEGSYDVVATVGGKALTLSQSYTSAPDIANAIAAGDKVGNWYALKNDGTMLSGSALTLTEASGAGVLPLNFDGNAYFVSSPVAFPAGDFSLVMVLNTPTVAGALRTLAGNFNGTNYSFILSTVTGAIEMDVQAAGGGFGTVVHTPALNTYVVVGVTYTSATGALKMRCEGANTTATAAGGGLINLGAARAHTLGGSTLGSLRWTGLSRGIFFTEKVLSDADIDRIGAGGL